MDRPHAATAPPVICLVGATGTGKSDVAVALARRLAASRGGAEVIAADAMTVYRGVPILTAAPTVPPDVPHHLLAVLDPSERYSAGRFLADADRLVAEIRARGRVPLIVGGTTLYVLTYLQGLGPRVERDEDLRARYEALFAREGAEAVWARLQALDPKRAASLHPHDLRRVVRALEIVERAGTPASALRRDWDAPARVAAELVVLQRDDADLRRRIQARTDAMFRAGLREEVEALRRRSSPVSPELTQAIGLLDVEALLRGELDEATCKERLVRATWRYTRRQATFLRRLLKGSTPSVVLDVPADEPPPTTAARAEAQCRALAPPRQA